jgi:hypothetical protein
MTRSSLLVVTAALSAALLPSARALAAGGKSPEQQRNAQVCKRLDEARKGKPALAEVRLEVVGVGSNGPRSLLLFGNGVGVWNGARQFRVDAKVVREMLTAIDKAGFCAWPDKASRIGREKEAEVEPDALQMDRAISLTIGDASKSVTHVLNSPESAAFTTLVARLLDTCEPDGQKGTAADSLRDGLAKVRDGALAPEVLQVTLNCPQQTATDPEGWLLRLSGNGVEAERNTKATGYTDRRRLRLTDRQVRDLATTLLDANFPGLPGNIVGTGYTDLRVEILSRTQAIQVRAFAGAPTTTRPDAQEAFAKLRQALNAIYQQATREGKPGSASISPSPSFRMCVA